MTETTPHIQTFYISWEKGPEKKAILVPYERDKHLKISAKFLYWSRRAPNDGEGILVVGCRPSSIDIHGNIFDALHGTSTIIGKHLIAGGCLKNGKITRWHCSSFLLFTPSALQPHLRKALGLE